MTFDQWKEDLAGELGQVFAMSLTDARKYIWDCGDDGWRESFDEGLTPKEAASEEAWAAMWDAE